jgi:hypothetical protein
MRITGETLIYTVGLVDFVPWEWLFHLLHNTKSQVQIRYLNELDIVNTSLPTMI